MNDKGGEEETEPEPVEQLVFPRQYLGSKIIIIQIRSLFNFLTVYHLHALRKRN